jgi:hypothetical protein
MSKKIIACDPGAEGAIALLSPDGSLLAAFNMPVKEIKKPKVKKKPKKDAPPKKKPKKESEFSVSRLTDYRGLFELLSKVTDEHGIGDVEFYVEEITHLFGLPAATNFKLGHASGVLQAAVSTFADEYYLVPVKKWQAAVWTDADKVFKENGRVDTKATTEMAFNRIFPGWQGINSDGVRDAALIGWYGLRGGL